MQWCGFFLSVFGAFISSHVLAMDKVPPITKIEPRDTPSVFLEPGTSTILDSQTFLERRNELSVSSVKSFSFRTSDSSDSLAFLNLQPKLSDSLKSFSLATSDISDPEFPFERKSKFFDLPLERLSVARLDISEPNSNLSLKNSFIATPIISDSEALLDLRPKLSNLSLGRHSFARSGLNLGSSSGSPPLDPHFLSFLPKPPKPIMREGIVLPKVDLGHLGIFDFFNERGIPLGKYDYYLIKRSPLLYKYELEKFKIQPLLNYELKTFDISSLLGSLTTTEEREGKPFKIPSLLDNATSAEEHEVATLETPSLLPKVELETFKDRFVSKEKRLYQTAIPDLTDEEIIILFKHLTSYSLFSFGSDEESIIKLKELLQDGRARKVILESSKDAENPISKALASATGFQGNTRKLKTLISADGFLEHLLSQPADEKGETALSKAFLMATYFNCLESLTIFFENQRICEHLSSIPDEKYQSVVMQGLMSAVCLNIDNVLPPFYKSRVIFDHLVSCCSRGALDAQVISKAYTQAGLLIALSERAEKEINSLLHEDVMRFIRENADLVLQVTKKAIEDRNPYLARKLLGELDLVISPAQIKDAIQVAAIWEVLSDDNKRTLLAKAQQMDPNLREEGLIRHHKQMSAHEHAIVGHPSVVNDMEIFAFEGYEKYKNLLTEVLNPLEREAQKKVLEREFLKAFPTKMAPWFHAEAEAAYDLKMFGQGVNGLVVELDVLPEHQRKGLLYPHLGEETVYKEEVTGSRSAHNIGVTSLVAQMAPMAAITSITTCQLQKLETLIAAAQYPFINCSWGPISEIKDTENPFSVFSSRKELNDLLGRLDVVLIKSAGNEGASLSDSESTEDIAGKVFSILLNRLEPNQLTNLILAVNLNPTNTVSDSSNTPGARDTIYRHTLSAQGSETFWLDEAGQHYRPIQNGGTSSAAPVVTGAAILLQSYKRAFSPVLIKACLLHSAQREFPIYGEDGVVNRGVYETAPSATWKQKELPQEQYSFSKYGMGILNVKSAFAYADLLEPYLTLRDGGTPVTFEEFESLRKKLPTRSTQNLAVELEI